MIYGRPDLSYQVGTPSDFDVALFTFRLTVSPPRAVGVVTLDPHTRPALRFDLLRGVRREQPHPFFSSSPD
jgi:hypothetical protein